MKTLVISTPAMGKTTLVKMHRTASWRNSSGVDFDLKGHNNHAPITREASTSLVNALFDAGHTFVTGFNGSFDFSKLTHRCHIVFVAPATKDAMQAALDRSSKRGDSYEFTQDMVSHLVDWAHDLYRAYAICKAQSALISHSLPHHVTFIGIRDAYTVIPHLFSFNKDTGELELRTMNEIEYSDHKFVPGNTIEYSGLLESPTVVQFENFKSSLLPKDICDGTTLYSHHRDAIYSDNLEPNPLGDDRVVTLVDSLTHLENDFDFKLRRIRTDDEVDLSSVKFSFDATEHSVPRARLTFDRVCPIYDEEDEVEDYHRYTVRYYWYCKR